MQKLSKDTKINDVEQVSSLRSNAIFQNPKTNTTSQKERLKLLVVDDHPVILEGIKTMLSNNDEVEVIGVASNGEEAVQKATELKPHVILMDVRMPEMDGIETTRRIKEINFKVVVVMFTMYDHATYVAEAVRAGAAGYVLKDASRDLLVHTIKAACSGSTLIRSSMLQAVLSEQMKENQQRNTVQVPLRMDQKGSYDTFTEHAYLPISPKGLTSRQSQIIKLVAQGLTNKEIGQTLHISDLTVKKHVADIIASLGANNRSQAVARAIQLHLLNLGQTPNSESTLSTLSATR